MLCFHTQSGRRNELPFRTTDQACSRGNTHRPQDFTFQMNTKLPVNLIVSETEVISSEVHATISDPRTAESYSGCALVQMRMHDAVSTKPTRTAAVCIRSTDALQTDLSVPLPLTNSSVSSCPSSHLTSLPLRTGGTCTSRR